MCLGGARAHHLLLAVHIDHQRRCKSIVLFLLRERPFRGPANLSRISVQTENDLFVDPIAVDHENSVDQGARSGATHHRVVLQLARLPDRLAIEGQARRPIRAEMDVDPTVSNQGRRCRVRILPVQALETRNQLVENRRVPFDLAGGGVQLQKMQFLAAHRRHRGRHKDSIAKRDRRRPALAGNWRFPSDVFRRTPVQRESFRSGVPHSPRSAELRPVLGWSRALLRGVRRSEGGRDRSVRLYAPHVSFAIPRYPRAGHHFLGPVKAVAKETLRARRNKGSGHTNQCKENPADEGRLQPRSRRFRRGTIGLTRTGKKSPWQSSLSFSTAWHSYRRGATLAGNCDVVGGPQLLVTRGSLAGCVRRCL